MGDTLRCAPPALAPANCIQLFTGAGDNYLLLQSVDGLIFTDNMQTKYLN